MPYPVEFGMPAYPPPLMPAHAGIQFSLRSRKPLKKLDSRLRGNERVGVRLPLLLATVVVARRPCRNQFPAVVSSQAHE